MKRCDRPTYTRRKKCFTWHDIDWLWHWMIPNKQTNQKSPEYNRNLHFQVDLTSQCFIYKPGSFHEVYHPGGTCKVGFLSIFTIWNVVECFEKSKFSSHCRILLCACDWYESVVLVKCYNRLNPCESIDCRLLLPMERVKKRGGGTVVLRLHWLLAHIIIDENGPMRHHYFSLRYSAIKFITFTIWKRFHLWSNIVFHIHFELQVLLSTISQ